MQTIGLAGHRLNLEMPDFLSVCALGCRNLCCVPFLHGW